MPNTSAKEVVASGVVSGERLVRELTMTVGQRLRQRDFCAERLSQAQLQLPQTKKRWETGNGSEADGLSTGCSGSAVKELVDRKLINCFNGCMRCPVRSHRTIADHRRSPPE